MINKCKCGSEAAAIKKGTHWKVVCSRNTGGLNDGCRGSGHVMKTKREAIRVWNEIEKEIQNGVKNENEF